MRRSCIPGLALVLGLILSTGSIPARGHDSPDLDGAAAIGSPTGPAREHDAAQESVGLEADLLPDTAYVGQQVTLRVGVAVPEAFLHRLRRAPEYEPPDPSGFWIHDLPNPPRTSRGRGGEVYELRTFERAYFPLSAGTFTLEPVRLLYEVRQGSFYSTDTRELDTDSLRLVVRPLPAEGRPPSFTGAVGRYQIRARVEPEELSAGDAAVLTVEVEGEGNVKALPAPEPPDIEGLRFYPPSEDTKVSVSDGRVTGTKTFSWVVIAEQEGRIDLPTIEYAFFDPDRQRYAVARAEAGGLHVRLGTAGLLEDDAAPTIRYLKLDPAPDRPLGWVRSTAFAALQILPLLALGLVVWGRRRMADDRPPSRFALWRRRRRAFAELRRLAETDDPEFFRRLDESIRDWLVDRLRRSDVRTASGAELRRLLDQLRVDDRAARGIAELVHRLERARYEPEPPDAEARRVYVRAAERALKLIDREAPRPSRRRTAAAAVLAGLLAVAAPDPAAAQSPDEPFRSGITAYHAEDFGEAVRRFRAYVRARPGDPNGWYNLGNAYHRQDERGRAIWAWLHALRLRPRDDDIRHNLTVAEAAPDLIRRVRPRPPLSTDEALLAAGLVWLITGGAWTAFALRRRRSAAAVAALGTLAALVVVAAWGVPRLLADPAVVLDDQAPLRAAPTARAERLRPLEAGAGIDIVDRRGDWLRISLPDGNEGWVEVSAVGTF